MKLNNKAIYGDDSGIVLQIGDIIQSWRCENIMDGIRCKNNKAPGARYCKFCIGLTSQVDSELPERGELDNAETIRTDAKKIAGMD